MSRSACLFALLTTLAASPAAAQRWATPVAELNDGVLAGHLRGQRPAIARCAAAEDTGAFLVEVRATVRRGPRPSSMHNARIALSVRSRPRDGAFEACVRRSLRDSLRQLAYAVERPARAHATLRLSERPDPHVERPPPPPYREAEVRRALRARDARFARCLEMAGVPERVVLRVAVEADGRLQLTSAEIPPGASRHAQHCLARAVERIRVRGRPARRAELTHTVAVRRRAY